MNTTLIVLKKELTDIFRDKKTLIIGILIPLLMYPILFGVMGKGMSGESKELQKSMKVAIVDKSNSKLTEFIKSQKNIDVMPSTNINEDVKNGNILLGIEVPDRFDEAMAQEKPKDIKVTYDNSNTKSNSANMILKSYIDQYSKKIVAERLGKRNIEESLLNPITIINKTSEKEKDGAGKMILGMLIPMMLVMFSAMGPITAATDLGAGEKERGTLEPLLTTQAGRLSLLWGKFLAVTIMGAITAIASLIGIFIAMNRNGEMFGSTGGNIPLEPKTLIIIGILTILLTMAFGALDLAISIYARSFKEAQTYLTPMSLVGMIGFSSYMMDPKNVSLLTLNIPIVNVTAVLKELCVGIYNYAHIGIVFAWIIIYIVLSISFARYMFNREEVIFRT